jgi:hypothetical protein
MKRATGSGSASSPSTIRATRRGTGVRPRLGETLFQRSDEGGTGLEFLPRFLGRQAAVAGREIRYEAIDRRRRSLLGHPATIIAPGELTARAPLEIADRFTLTGLGVLAILDERTWCFIDGDVKRVLLVLVGVEEAVRDEFDANELRRNWTRQHVV